MLLMATDEKKDDGPKKPNRKGVPLHIWLDAQLRAAIDALAETNRRPLTTEVSIALENHLKAAGLWPPRKPVKRAKSKDDND